jgi:hypothetical protein
MDNAPGVLFKNGTVIANDDDALFEVEGRISIAIFLCK